MFQDFGPAALLQFTNPFVRDILIMSMINWQNSGREDGKSGKREPLPGQGLSPAKI